MKTKSFITSLIFSVLTIAITVFLTFLISDINLNGSNLGLAILFPIIALLLIGSIIFSLTGSISSGVAIGSQKKIIKINSILCLILNLACLGLNIYYTIKILTILF